MKRSSLRKLMAIGVGVLSGIGTFTAGYMCAKSVYEARAEEEIQQMREHYLEKLGEKADKASERVVRAQKSPDKPSLESLAKKYTSEVQKPLVGQNMASQGVSDIEDEEELEEKEALDEIGEAHREMREAQLKMPPALIDASEFGEDPYYHTSTLLYYRMDDVYVNDIDESIVDDPEELLGDSIDLSLEEGAKFYVRNYRLGTEYEVIAVEDSFR